MNIMEGYRPLLGFFFFHEEIVMDMYNNEEIVLGYRPLAGLHIQTLEPEVPSEPEEPVLPSPLGGLS